MGNFVSAPPPASNLAPARILSLLPLWSLLRKYYVIISTYFMKHSEIITVSYILKLNDFLFCVCSFVICAELIEELARATDLKFGMRVEDVVATNKF